MISNLFTNQTSLPIKLFTNQKLDFSKDSVPEKSYQGSSALDSVKKDKLSSPHLLHPSFE